MDNNFGILKNGSCKATYLTYDNNTHIVFIVSDGIK